MAARPSLLPSEIKTISKPRKIFYIASVFILKKFRLFVKHNRELLKIDLLSSRRPPRRAHHKNTLCKEVNKTAIDRIRSIAVKLSRYARRMILLGSLSYELRGDPSLFTGMYYKAEYGG